MKNNITSLNRIIWEAKINLFKHNVKKKIDDTLTWCVKNPEKAAIAGTVVLGVTNAVLKGTRLAIREHQINKEQAFKATTIYDHSLGCYHQMKRALKPSEKVLISERRRNGEKMAMILNDMGLLK